MEEKDDDHDMKHLAIKPNMRIYTMQCDPEKYRQQ